MHIIVIRSIGRNRKMLHNHFPVHSCKQNKDVLKHNVGIIAHYSPNKLSPVTTVSIKRETTPPNT